MPVNRFNQGSKTTAKPRALNSVKKSVGKSNKAIYKKSKSSKKCTSPPSISPGFSLYSSDSESSAGVSSLNHGLDRCAALLANILDEHDASVVPNKTSTTKKLPIPSRQILKGKQLCKHNTVVSKPSQNLKKNKPRQGISKKPVGNVPGTNKPEIKPSLEVKVPQVTQFNDRLVSSTPDMRSPTSDNHESRCVPEAQSTHTQNLSAHGDPSLEALAAQIQMLRSQAEVTENQKEHCENIPVRDITTHVQSASRVQPSAFQYEKVGPSQPKQVLQSLTDHLKYRNMKHQLYPLETTDSELNHSMIRSQTWQNQSQEYTNQTKTCSSSHQVMNNQPPYTQFIEPPESRNTSFIPEYHQLPDQNLRSSQHDKMIKQQLNEIQTSVPASHHPPITEGKQMVNAHVHDTVKVKQISDQSPVQMDKVPRSQIYQLHQTHQEIQPTEPINHQDKSEIILERPISKVCMGTQTYSPPADKSVQTSVVCSPLRSEIYVIPTKDAIGSPIQDTPHPQPKLRGKKNASWEQMRILKYLFGELRAAIGDIGDDRDVQRLLTEIEECLDTLQYLPPDLQTEIGLALQPLRSENTQLRRRLRIANQQIRKLENCEDKENMEPPVHVEVLTLQSLNAKLQKELREEESKHERLIQSNMEYKSTIENMKQKHQDLMKILQQKDAHQLDSRREWMEEKSALNNQIDEMHSQVKNLQFRVNATDNENRILRLNLEQRDADIAQLHQGPHLKYFHCRSKADNDEKYSVAESDDDDDETPKASPQHSPQKTCTLPSSRNNLDNLNQCPDILNRTSKFGKLSEKSPDKDYPLTKRVTFAGYISPKHSVYPQEMPAASPGNAAYVGNGNHTVPQYGTEQQAMSRQYEPSDPLHLLQAEAADMEFTMTKFLEQSEHLSSDEDVVESVHSDTGLNKPDVYPITNVPHQSSTKTTIDNIEKRTQSHKLRQFRYNHNRYDDNVLPSKASPENEPFQQHPCLDGNGAISFIDSSSTQSSVTSQYEAQFQLGLANLDNEISKLQNSLRSMSSRKPIHNLKR